MHNLSTFSVPISWVWTIAYCIAATQNPHMLPTGVTDEFPDNCLNNVDFPDWSAPRINIFRGVCSSYICISSNWSSNLSSMKNFWSQIFSLSFRNDSSLRKDLRHSVYHQNCRIKNRYNFFHVAGLNVTLSVSFLPINCFKKFVFLSTVIVNSVSIFHSYRSQRRFHTLSDE